MAEKAPRKSVRVYAPYKTMSPFRLTRDELMRRTVGDGRLTKTEFRAAVRKVREIEAEDGHYPPSSTSTAAKLAIDWNFL